MEGSSILILSYDREFVISLSITQAQPRGNRTFGTLPCRRQRRRRCPVLTEIEIAGRCLCEPLDEGYEDLSRDRIDPIVDKLQIERKHQWKAQEMGNHRHSCHASVRSV